MCVCGCERIRVHITGWKKIIRLKIHWCRLDKIYLETKWYLLTGKVGIYLDVLLPAFDVMLCLDEGVIQVRLDGGVKNPTLGRNNPGRNNPPGQNDQVD